MTPSDAEVVLSVVVPTHGRVELFVETLQSLEAQSFSRFEVIVADDSTRTEDRRAIQTALDVYRTRTGRPARYLFSQPSLGQARNTNQGLADARGRFVRILHSDDVLATTAIEAEVALLSDSRLGLEVLFHLAVPFVEAPKFDRQPAATLVQPAQYFRACLHSGTPLPSATVFAREVLTEVGGMREDFDFLCDWEFFYRLLLSQHRRHRFIGRLTHGYVGWRVHPDSTTGRLWHRHFLEHEQFMAELESDDELTETLIGDAGTRAGFFATAVRYRYRRLADDISRMAWRDLVLGLPRIVRCALSRRSLVARLTPPPWSALGARRYPKLVVETAVAGPGGPPSAARFVEPRTGLRFVLSAYASAAIIRWGKARARRAPDAEFQALPDSRYSGVGPALVPACSVVEISNTMNGTDPEPDAIRVIADFNNSTNFWAVRKLIESVPRLVLRELNANAFVEPVLHQCLKFTAPGSSLEVRLFENQHLTSFGFKALLDRLFPQQFVWRSQRKDGALHVLRYERSAPAHDSVAAPHTGWTFGMLTMGTRLANVEQFIDSIERCCDEPYEILIVSPVGLGAIEARRGVRVLRFSERDDLGWITRKKNLICREAAFSDVLICHDRFSLDREFTRQFASWGYAFGLAAPRVRLAGGRRGLDWGVVSSQNLVWSSGGLLDYRAYSQYAYNPGGATVIRKAFWRDFPWNESLFWNEHEDVELCRRIQRAGGIIALAASTVIASEDRWADANPHIPYCDQNEVLFGRPVGEQRIMFLPKPEAA